MLDVPVVGGEICSMESGSTLNPPKLLFFAAVFRTFNTLSTTTLWLNFISKSNITLPGLKTRKEDCTVPVNNLLSDRNGNFLSFNRAKLC